MFQRMANKLIKPDNPKFSRDSNSDHPVNDGLVAICLLAISIRHQLLDWGAKQAPPSGDFKVAGRLEPPVSTFPHIQKSHSDDRSPRGRVVAPSQVVSRRT
jgi:hypothetical protein